MANSTRFAAAATLTSDKDGGDQWVVAVKGTFVLEPDGRMRPAEEQEPVSRFPVHVGDPAKSSLLRECDLDYAALGTDVVLHASAYAPGGQPVRDLLVDFAIGRRTKVLRVTGERVWKTRFGVVLPGAPAPFLRMPICYERPMADGLRMARTGARRIRPVAALRATPKA